MTDWSTVTDLVDILTRRWNQGRYLNEYATRTPWSPVTLPVRGPRSSDLADGHFDAIRSWTQRFDTDLAGRTRDRMRVEHRTIRTPLQGAHQVPARVHIDTFDHLCALLRTTASVHAIDRILDQTTLAVPDLLSWVQAHTLTAVEHSDAWDRLLTVVRWIADHDAAGLYVRQLDLPDVDTKFIEHHHRLLDQLLQQILPQDRIANDAARFDRRYGFRTRPPTVPIRFLAPQLSLPAGITQLTVPADELPNLHLQARTVIVIENEITWLAFPDVPDTITIWGSGYALSLTNIADWLAERNVIYWGDLDTHGFAILARLRRRLPNVQSMLMDRQTLLNHRPQWGTEPVPERTVIDGLTTNELDLYRDLVENRYGRQVRLEQERISLSRIPLQRFEPYPSLTSGTAPADMD